MKELLTRWRRGGGVDNGAVARSLLLLHMYVMMGREHADITHKYQVEILNNRRRVSEEVFVVMCLHVHMYVRVG